MPTIIDTRQALDALPQGTTMLDVDGWHITKGDGHNYWVVPVEGYDTDTPNRTYLYDAGEIAGEYGDDDDESSFFPLTLLSGSCWYCEGATMRTDGRGEWSCCPSHDEQ